MTDIHTEHAAVVADHVYAVSITRLRIRRVWRAPAFFAAVGGVLQQTRATPGMTRHGFRIRPLRLEFWTYGVFDDAPALGRFTGAAPHGPAMRRLRGRLGPLEAARLDVRGADLPGDWESIAALLAGPRRRARSHRS